MSIRHTPQGLHQELQSQIEKDIQEFLDSGKNIQHLPSGVRSTAGARKFVINPEKSEALLDQHFKESENGEGD